MAKNIILLADGTGNSERSPFKTNVWRLYQALDCTGGAGRREQVVFYTSGVGTETFKPLALLGGAFGLGVWANVRDLYTFLCRNFRHGDAIYLFGFSRGAFTVRLLAGLIGRCGLVQGGSEAELIANIRRAYRAYRRDFLYRASKSPQRPPMFWHWFLRRPELDDQQLLKLDMPRVVTPIRFIGVWDTVDAYGMPVDEWKQGIDQWVWPMSVADRSLSDRIDRAAQALSLDDERPTFRPVLWTETPSGRRELTGGRLTQVWFAGVHANVGGGYPDDGLAYVTLDWMMSQVEPDVLFHADLREDVRRRADPQGEYYDSRAGIAGYYRYGPRDVAALCNDPRYGVSVETPKIHTSVWSRVFDREVAYAPISLPPAFDLVAANGTSRPENAPVGGWMDKAQAAVRRRRWIYFWTVVLTLVIAALPLLDKVAPLQRALDAWIATICADPRSGGFCEVPKFLLSGPTYLMASIDPSFTLDSIREIARSVAPRWAMLWIEPMFRHPSLSIVLVALLAWLFLKKSEDAQDTIAEYAEKAWLGRRPPAPPRFARLRRKLRGIVAAAYHWFASWVMPALFGVGTLLFLITLAVVTLPLSLLALVPLYRFLREDASPTAASGGAAEENWP
ncbi:MAG: DUF2235 domain-containing protein [Variibacter sp.]